MCVFLLCVRCVCAAPRDIPSEQSVLEGRSDDETGSTLFLYLKHLMGPEVSLTQLQRQIKTLLFLFN